jgi:periplasmic divalent cation tolerance protein
MSKFRLVLVTTHGIDEAERIAHKIVEKRLAACVNILPKVRSIYRWQNDIQEDREALMLIKTDAKHLSKLEKQIRKMHSYDVPEFLVVNIDGGSDTYLDWLGAVLGVR